MLSTPFNIFCAGERAALQTLKKKQVHAERNKLLSTSSLINFAQIT
jgi:hypothetical protein